jgi:hypothetical protein
MEVGRHIWGHIVQPQEVPELFERLKRDDSLNERVEKRFSEKLRD